MNTTVHVFFLFLLGASDTRIRTCYENTHCPHGVPVLLDDNTRIRSLEVADAYKEKKQQAKISAAKKQRTGAFDRQSKVGVTATASPQCQSPVEQPWRRACAAGLTDSRAPRASRSTRGTTHPARRSAQQEYCDMLHNAKDSTEKLAPVAHQHVSAPGEGACCAR